MTKVRGDNENNSLYTILILKQTILQMCMFSYATDIW